MPLLAELTAYAEHEPALDRRLWARPVVPEHDTDLVSTGCTARTSPSSGRWRGRATGSATTSPARSRTPRAARTSASSTTSPVGYVEVYDPHRDVLGAHAPVLPGDLGAHVLIGDEEHLGRYSVSLGRATVRMLFKRPDVLRIVGEPDVRNENFLSLLAFLGFRRQCDIDLPDKRAAFMVCERADFERLASRRRRATR